MTERLQADEQAAKRASEILFASALRLVEEPKAADAVDPHVGDTTE
jgi:hypothetical protein